MTETAIVADAVGPHLLPDPALDWLRRAHGALGVWVAELQPAEEGPRAERIVDAERLSVAQIVAVDRRLERARDAEESGTVTLDSGTFVFCAGAGTAVGILLPEALAPPAMARAVDDLRRLLVGVQRKPQAIAQAQTLAGEASFESSASIALRLAYQLERTLVAHELGGEVAVVAHELVGVRVIGVSGRADRRLLDGILRTASPLARVARGELPEEQAVPDPFGGLVPDRRRREISAVLLPIAVEEKAVGAVALLLGEGMTLPALVRAEIAETLTNAAPRLARALETDRHAQAATVDALTGLLNERGFQERLTQRGARHGAMIHLDLDRGAVLNDTLGEAAGDAALAHIARVIQDHTRAYDVAARVEGGRFAIWLPEADGALGMRVAERVRQKVEAIAWEWQGRVWPLAASFGVAACPETVPALADLPAQASVALQAAKRNGRNRVEKAG